MADGRRDRAPGRGRWHVNVALMAISVILFFGALELCLRALHFGRFLDYRKDEETGLVEFIPDQRAYSWLHRIPMTINSRGYRGPARPAPRVAGALRILSIGDSVTFGIELPDEDTYAAQLETLLRERSSGAAPEVINAGVPGYSLKEYATFLEREGPRFGADITILGFCINDAVLRPADERALPKKAGVDREKIGFLAKAALLAGTVKFPPSLKQFAIVHLLESLRMRAILASTEGVERSDPETFMSIMNAKLDAYEALWRRSGEEHLRALADQLEASGTEPILLIFPQLHHLDRDVDRSAYRGLIHRVAADRGIPVIDLYPPFRAYPGDPADLFTDPGHLSREGNRVAAAAVLALIDSTRME